MNLWSRLGTSRIVIGAVLIGYFALGAAWSFAAPYNGSADEQDHVVRAVGVVHGQVAPKSEDVAFYTGAMQTVPRDLTHDMCFQFRYDQSAACDTRGFDDQTMVPTATKIGRYNPVYYAVVGWPMRFSPDMQGLYASRLLTSLLVAGLLALAAAAAMRWSRHRIMLAGVVLMATPAVLNVAGTLNPSAVEVAAGILLFTALIPLFDPEHEIDPRMIWYAGVAAVVLATLRGLGPFWLGVAMLVLLIPVRWARVKQVWFAPRFRAWAIVVTIAVLASAAWTIGKDALVLGRGDPINPPYEAAQTIEYLTMTRWVEHLYQMVAGLGWLDVPVPPYVPLLWYVMIGLLVVGGGLFGGRLDRLRIAAITLIAFGVPMLTDGFTATLNDYPSQGRYLMPLFAGAVLLGGVALVRAGVLTGPRAASLLRATGVVVIILHLTCLFAAMVRWQSGASLDARRPHFNPLVGEWQPEVGSLLPFTLGIVGAVVLGWACWRAAAVAAEPPDQEDDQPLAVEEHRPVVSVTT